MKQKFLLLLTLIVVGVSGVWADLLTPSDLIKASTTLPASGTPEHQFYVVGVLHGYYWDTNTAPSKSAPAKFAFYKVDGVDGAYDIYDVTAGKWLTYTSGTSYNNTKNFVSLTSDNTRPSNTYFKVTKTTNKTTEGAVPAYGFQPYQSDGNVHGKYLNYFQGAGSGNTSVGLWQDAPTSDNGSAWAVVDVDNDVISANFGTDVSVMDNVTTEVYHNGVGKAGWFTIAGSTTNAVNGTHDAKDQDGNTIGSLKLNTPQVPWGPSATKTNLDYAIESSYLDLSANNQWTINMTTDFLKSDLYLYMAGDGNAFSPVSVNGTSYIGGSDKTNIQVGSADSWGTRAYNVDLTKSNTVIVTGLAGGYHTYTNVPQNSTEKRGTLGGLQLVDRTGYYVYTCALAANANASDLNWSKNGATSTISSIAEADRYLSVSGTYDLTFDSEVIQGLIVTSGTVTIKGTTKIEQLLVANGASVKFEAEVANDAMTITGRGTVTAKVSSTTYSKITNHVSNITWTSVTYSDNQTSNLTSGTHNPIYAGGAGTSSSRVSIEHNGGTVTLTGSDKTYYLSETHSDTQTTVNMDGTTVNYGDALGIGKATYNFDNTTVTAARFITSQGAKDRPAVVNMTGSSKITVSGSTISDANTNSVMIGHWNGSSNVTLSGNAEIEAVNTQFLVGKTGNTQTITVSDNAVINTKGIYVSSGASGTNTFNLNGGTLKLGTIGFTGASGKTMTINVGADATVTATGVALPISQPINVAAGKTLTIDGGDIADVSLTGTITKGEGSSIVIKDAKLSVGETRDLTSFFNSDCTYSGNCVLVVTETTAEFNTAQESIEVTNIPSFVTKVILKRANRKYVDMTLSGTTATFTDNSAKVSGPAAWLDYTFEKATREERRTESTSSILNSGSAGSNVGLNYDSGFNSGNSYNEENGFLKVKSTPWRDMSDDYAWPIEYSVAVYANVPDVDGGCLMAFGSSTGGSGKYLAIARGADQNTIKLVKGSGQAGQTEVIATMTAENATVAKHLIVFTKQQVTQADESVKNVFKVYCDGVNVATTTYDETLGSGFQVGSVHGGINTGIGLTRVNLISDDTKKNACEIQSIRVFNSVLTSNQMSLLQQEFPYKSKGGTYTRTIATKAENLSSDAAWNDGTNDVALPTTKTVEGITYNPDATITTNETSTLTVNENATFGKLTFGGTNALTIAADAGKSINVTGAVIVNSALTVKYGALDMSGTPVTKGAGVALKFDFSDYDFSKVYTTQKIQLTGLIGQDDDHITAIGLPTNNSTRQFSFGYDDNHYWLTVTVRAAQDVYAPAGTTAITDDMAVKLTADAETNDGLLIPGDVLNITTSETMKFNQTMASLAVKITNGATLTLNNSDRENRYALNGETVTIDNGTLKLYNGNGNDDANINNATINISQNGALDNYGWITVGGTLTINTSYDKTILTNSGNNNARIKGTGKIVKGGTGTLTFKAYTNNSQNTDVHPIQIDGGTVILPTDSKAGAITGTGTLSVAAGNKITVASMASNTKLAGAGTLALSAFSTTGPDKTSWTGAVEFPATSENQNNLTTILNAWGTANSTIKLNNVTGYFNASETIVPTLNILADATVKITNGSSNNTPVVTKLIGAGTLEDAWSAGTNHKIKIATLTDFTGTLAATAQSIEVANLVLAEAPQVDQLLIKTSGTVTLSKLTIGTIESSAYTWETKEVEEVNGIYVTAFNNVAQKRDEANAVVKPYADYIGEGVGKYTITLGENKYTTMASYTEAVNAWTSVEDYVAPTVAINSVPAGFYRFASANNGNAKTNAGKYLTPKSDGTGYTYNETADASNIYYYDGEGFVIRLDNGYALKGYNDSKELKATLVDLDNGDYRWRFSENTNGATKGKYALKYNGSWYLSDTGWFYDANPSANACWTIEPVTELPLTFKSSFLGYSTFCSPVPVTIPENTSAYVCKKNENTLTFYQITAIKDANDKVTIPANTAVLLYNSTVSDENVSVTFPVTEYVGKVNNNSLEGTLATVTFDANDQNNDWYSLRTSTVNETAMVGFYKKTAGDTRAGFKAWLKTEHTTEARNFTIYFDGEEGQTTGLVEALGIQNAEIYDLSGRKLSTVKNGINIVNGKKIIK